MLLGFRRTLPLTRGYSLLTIRTLSPAASLAPLPPPPPPPPAIPTPISPSNLETLILSQYRSPKFHDLLATVVSHPSVLLAASHNLASRANSHPPSPDSISHWISVDALSRELQDGDLHVPSCCAAIIPSRKKGEREPLVLPNLKLKVVMEALRMVLEVVYDKRLATFAYGGRAGMGRHTAVRYLKSSIQNPTWWFRVALRREPFGSRHLRRLSAVIAEKIEDASLISLIEQLFGSEAVVVEMGGVGMGRGFPQESNLNAILVNIYFDRLDREIQDIRLKVHCENPRLSIAEGEGEAKVFHRSLRVYAVRYLDEILVISSGSKMFTMNIKDSVLKYLEGELELKVDKLMTSIHSAVSEKIGFMGMELQAVTPSVLHPPMSEKAIRAKKKYLKRKAAKSLEMKNARETIRKKLGMKIWSNAFKKMKRCGGFKFDFQIESEVREIFRSWADDAVAEFFRSKEECWSWHRMLTSGDFLSLKRVRDQLPPELVDAYDEFQENVNKYLIPVIASNDIEEEERQEEEEEERIYARRTVEDLTELRMRVNAPIELVRKAVKLAGFTNPMGRPRPIKLLICLDDADIIKWYAGVGRRWLEFFCCCRNFKMLKIVVNYHLRFSCFLTLAEKHESTKREAIRHYTKDLKANDGSGMEVHFPTEREIRMMGDKNLSDPKPADGALCMILVRLAFSNTSCSCLAHFCDRTDAVLYRIRLLQNRLNVDPLNEGKWVPGMGSIHESLNKKCLPLCSKHSSDLFLGAITLQDIDCTSFIVVE